MKIKIPKRKLLEPLWDCIDINKKCIDINKIEALKCDENGCLELKFKWSCVSEISDSEIDILTEKFMWLYDGDNVVDDYIKRLTENDKIKLIQELKEQLCDAYAEEEDFFLEFFNERFDYETKQAIIKKLIEQNPSVEKAQELIKNLKAHNESDTGKDKQ